jgi:hypothetical protein
MPRHFLLTSAFVLVLAFIWGNTGSSCMEAVHQWHREKQQAHFRHDAADSLVIPYAEYLSLTAYDQEEIRYHGRMYDITSVRVLGRSVVLHGHYDDFDAALFRMVDNFIGHSGAASKDTHRTALFVYNAILPASDLLPFSRFAPGPECHIVRNAGAIPVSFSDVLKAPPERSRLS